MFVGVDTVGVPEDGDVVFGVNGLWKHDVSEVVVSVVYDYNDVDDVGF